MNRIRGLVLFGAVLVSGLLITDSVLAQDVISFIDARRDIAVRGGARSIAVGDFNGDSIQDLAVAYRYSNNMSVLLGNNDGRFQAAWSITINIGPSALAVDDFNGDGIANLAVTGYYGGVILLGCGDGTFEPGQSFQPANGTSILVADFNRDDIPDLAVASLWNVAQGSVSILLGNGNGTFQEMKMYDFEGGASSIAVADFKGTECWIWS